jgi:hypothetical protein
MQAGGGGGGGGDDYATHCSHTPPGTNSVRTGQDKIHKYIFRVQKIVKASKFEYVISLSFCQRATKRSEGHVVFTFHIFKE